MSNDKRLYFINGNDDDNFLKGTIFGDLINGLGGNDTIKGRKGDDEIRGDNVLIGEDFDEDGYLKPEIIERHGNDHLKGGRGNDVLISALGSDKLSGGTGNDVLISLSDSNVPLENPDIPVDTVGVNNLDFTQEFYNPDDLQANDILRGGAGNDEYYFKLLINAKDNIIAKHRDEATGAVDWRGVAGENNNYHDHWVDGIGTDTIRRFREGDKITIEGHTVVAKELESKRNKSVIGLYSDQGADGQRGNGAHDFDVLGKIIVHHDGSFNFDEDVKVNAKVFYGSFDGSLNIINETDNVVNGTDDDNFLKGTMLDERINGLGGNDKIAGKKGDDEIRGDNVLIGEDFDANGYLTSKIIKLHGNDILRGGQGDDTLISALGRDKLGGGRGNDVLISLSDSNVPLENPDIPVDTVGVNNLDFTQEFYNPDDLQANDILRGGAGNDEYYFKLLINAKDNIIAKHRDEATGAVDWRGVAGENNNYHDHWVDGIGFDKIRGFSEGDKITIEGHTVAALELESRNNKAVIGLYSDQGADGARGNGAHDFDVLGKITVHHDGSFNFAEDVTVNANVFYGSFA